MTQIRGATLPTDLAKTDTSQTWTGTQDFTGATVLGVSGPGGTSPDATTTSKGLVQLAGDLAGTAAAPTVPGLAGKVNAAALAAVATSGQYADLTGRPALAGVATSGAYADLTGRPALAPVATSGAYGDLTGAPVAGPTVYARGKTAATSRASTTTAALDPDMQATVQPGTYLAQLVMSFDCGAGGLNLYLGGTAGITGGTVNPGQLTIGATLAQWTAPGSLLNIATTAQSQLPVIGTAVIPVVSAGTLGLMWGPWSNNATATVIRAGSALLLTKVA